MLCACSSYPQDLMRDGKLDVLVITGGHPFESIPFFAMFDADSGIEWVQAKQPAAQAFFNPRIADVWDAYLLYDLPGVEFRDGRAIATDPPPEVMRGFEELAENGHGFVVLHHAIAGWPTWTAWGEAIGARFHYLPGFYGGREYPDSGYRFDTWHRLTVATPRHPVAIGLGEGFEIVDELYLFPVDEHRVTAILKSDYEFTDVNFSSAALGVAGRRGRRDGWSHPPGSNFVAWSCQYRNSEIIVIQCGDGPSAYANPGLRRLIGNSLRWVARHRHGGPAVPYSAS